MRKFILIDHSIKNSGGHHLEYALRVLKAAKRNGFETVLAVNKTCKNFESSAIDVLDKSFSYGFWENFACEKQAVTRNQKSFFQALVVKKDDLIYDILFSQLGFAYRLLSEGKSASGLVKKYHLVSEGQRVPVWTIVIGALLLRLRHYQKKTKSLFGPFIKAAGKPGRLLLRVFKFFGGVMLAPVVLIYLALRWRNVSGRFDRFSALFATECHGLLARIGANEGDVIFVPTLGDVELTGIGLCSRAKALSGIEWHLLFRRNLFVGREPSFLRQMEMVQKTQLVLSEFKQNFAFGKVAFYTDTVPLTEQWNLLGVYSFQTLPIPQDEGLRKKRHELGSPIIVSYIGDARDEKGFQYLARLVGDIRAAGYNSEKVKFRFQSNFNIPMGEPGSRIAKAELSLMFDNGVELLEGPFDSDEYASLISASDILLVPYDENNYYARSSGVFAEALVAGVPVVYPAKSWMGRELLEENIKYCELLEGQCVQTPWNSLLKSAAPKEHVMVSRTLQNPVAFFHYKLVAEQPGRYARLSFYEVTKNKSLAKDKEEGMDFVGSVLIDLRSIEGSCFYRLNGAADIVIQLESCDDPNCDLSAQDPASYFIDFRYRLTDAQESLDLQSVGYGYDAVEDLSVGLKEILSRYQSYERRSFTFAENWSCFHSASTLVEMLTHRGEGE